MSSMAFNDKARWIWTPESSRPANIYTCFRRNFAVNPPLQNAQLLITADARYEVFINGEWFGHGPTRSWTSPWPVDEYDVMRALHPGDNVIGVIVQDIGVSTFQYILGAPGLIAEIELHDQTGHRDIVTNQSWTCKPHAGYCWPVPRISNQQGWEEQFDARTAHGLHNWKRVDYDDSEWNPADVRGRGGEPPHTRFERREIPFLTRDPVSPDRVVDIEHVQSADYTWHLAPRRLLNPSDRTANRICGKMLLLSHIYSPSTQQIRIQGLGEGQWKLNGRQLIFDDHYLNNLSQGIAVASLQEGWNTLLGRMPEMAHNWSVSLNMWSDEPVEFAAHPDVASEASPWLALGPFAQEPAPDNAALGEFVEADQVHEDATSACFDRLWSSGIPDQEALEAPFCRRVGPDMCTEVDVFAITASDQPVEGGEVEVSDVSAMLSNNEDWTTIEPPENGEDVRLLLDFGDEVVGFHEFEVDAPDGTIIDNQNFEFIQRDGRLNLAEKMNNTWRYVCRDGRQRYRTFVRRGFRYSWVTLRDFDRPVRIRYVRAISNTYPITPEGAFDSSDHALQRLWDVGVQTLRCCAEDTYTDCPTYEQAHWVGDARHEALIHLLASGDPRLSRHCWLQAARSLDRSPLVESHVPSGWPCILTAWSLLWMRWAQEHYMLTGDEELAQDMLRYVERNVCGLEQHINEDDLLEINAWNMLDWADMDTPDKGIVTHQNCLAVLALRQVSDLARQVGQKGRAHRWNALADRLASAVNTHLWSDERQAYIDCIHEDGRRSSVMSEQTHCMAYLAEIGSGDRLERCRDIVLSPPDDFVTAGSPFYVFFALEAMAKAGRYQKLLETIREYWKPQIDAGATTFWEAYWPERNRQTRSHCHAWSAAPTYFLPREILGIKPRRPGYNSVLIAPHPCDLDWAHGRVPTPHGTVECQWKLQQNTFQLDIRLPQSIHGRIHLPHEGVLDVSRGNTQTIDSPPDRIYLDCKGPRVTLQLRRNQS